MPHDPARIAAIAIGRNEGERLGRCLASLAGQAGRLIYVDSGSTDGSLAVARAAGAEVVELDLTTPFTAARARNAGFEALRHGGLPDYVQFVDGDCEIQPDWIAAATAFLDARPGAVVACGRRRERFPDASIYNRFCDLEWDTPVGEALACGGDALMRASAFDAAGGFDPAVIAGEEPELCVRLRAAGGQVWRLDREMTLHDAAMTRFGQWWKRTRRAGHANAEGYAMHGWRPERHGRSGTLRPLFWTLVLPLAAIGLGMSLHPAGFLLLLAWPVQIVRMALRDGGSGTAWASAFFIMLGKIPEVLGVLEYAAGRLTRRPSQIIEYK
ncbi:MAG: glycosyltransferase family A protein [Pseudomonadota bacterium]